MLYLIAFVSFRSHEPHARVCPTICVWTDGRLFFENNPAAIRENEQFSFKKAEITFGFCGYCMVSWALEKLLPFLFAVEIKEWCQKIKVKKKDHQIKQSIWDGLSASCFLLHCPVGSSLRLCLFKPVD